MLICTTLALRKSNVILAVKDIKLIKERILVDSKILIHADFEINHNWECSVLVTDNIASWTAGHFGYQIKMTVFFQCLEKDLHFQLQQSDLKWTKIKYCKKFIQILVAHANLWYNVSTADVSAVTNLLKKATFLN